MTDFYAKPDFKNVLDRVQKYRALLDRMRWTKGLWTMSTIDVRTSALSLENEVERLYGSSADFVIRSFPVDEELDGAWTHPPMYFKYTGPAPDDEPLYSLDQVGAVAFSPRLKPMKHKEKLSPIAGWVGAARFHRGNWLKVPQVNGAAATYIKQGVSYDAAPGEFVTTTRKIPGQDRHTVDLYIMYVGDRDYGVADIDPDGLCLEAPTKAKSPVAGDTIALNDLGNGASKIATWLEDFVRPARGDWVQFPGFLDKRAYGRIRRGDLYGASKGEFELHRDTDSDAVSGRVKAEWQQAVDNGTVDQFRIDAATVPEYWRGTVAEWVEKQNAKPRYENAVKVELPAPRPDSDDLDHRESRFNRDYVPSAQDAGFKAPTLPPDMWAPPPYSVKPERPESDYDEYELFDFLMDGHPAYDFDKEYPDAPQWVRDLCDRSHPSYIYTIFDIVNLAGLTRKGIAKLMEHPSLLPSPPSAYIVREFPPSIEEWLERTIIANTWVDYPGPALDSDQMREVEQGFGNAENYTFEVFSGSNADNIPFTRARPVAAS